MTPSGRSDPVAPHQRTPNREGSVTPHLNRLGVGDERGLNALWQRYFQQLVELARRKISRKARKMAPPEEVAGSVMRLLWDGARRNMFDRLNDRHDLWRILVLLTEHKVIDLHRRGKALKRGGEAAQPDGRKPLDQIPADEPTPALLAAMNDEQQRLLRLLPGDSLRQVALWKLEGYSTEEMAARLEVSQRTIERKLWVIREAWKGELERREE